MLTIKTPETSRRSGVFIANFEYISHLFLLFNLEQAIVSCAIYCEFKTCRAERTPAHTKSCTKSKAKAMGC